MQLSDAPLTSLTPRSELNLIEHFKARDPRALADAYQRYKYLVFWVIVRIVHNSTIAEDLVQESFLRAWSRASQIEEASGGLRPWLVAIARNSALDYVKSAAAKLARREALGDSAVPAGIEDEILVSERHRLLQEALRRLTPLQKQVIELAYHRGLSQREIADCLHQPLGTVKGRTRLALQHLRAVMDSRL